MGAAEESTGGEVANALVCKTSIRGFNSRPVLHNFGEWAQTAQGLKPFFLRPFRHD